LLKSPGHNAHRPCRNGRASSRRRVSSAALGGRLGPDAIAIFTRYAERVVVEPGDLMPFVCTINEPQMLALHGYLEGRHPPGVTDAVAWKRVGRVSLEAHQAAARAVRAGPGEPKAGLAVQLPLLVAAREDPDCRALHRMMRGGIADLYLDGLTGPERVDYLAAPRRRRQAREEGVDVRGYLH
jgi:beta-glucosidase